MADTALLIIDMQVGNFSESNRARSTRLWTWSEIDGNIRDCLQWNLKVREINRFSVVLWRLCSR